MTDTKPTKPQVKPETTIRRGAVAASIWKRQASSGFEYFDFSLIQNRRTQEVDAAH